MLIHIFDLTTSLERTKINDWSQCVQKQNSCLDLLYPNPKEEWDGYDVVDIMLLFLFSINFVDCYPPMMPVQSSTAGVTRNCINSTQMWTVRNITVILAKCVWMDSKVSLNAVKWAM